MSLNICIIEDEMFYTEHLINSLKFWCKKNGESISIKSYKDGRNLDENNIKNYNAFFLDIQLPGVNGLEIAKKLRFYQYEGAIIFLTNYHEYVYDGYEVNAIYYLIKPISIEDLNKCMIRISQSLHKIYYTFTYNSAIYQIAYQDIFYFSSANHYVEIFSRNGVYLHKGKFKELYKRLPLFFIQCHRTLIVNIYHVEKLHSNLLTLRNESLPVSNTYIQDIRKALLVINT